MPSNFSRLSADELKAVEFALRLRPEGALSPPKREAASGGAPDPAPAVPAPSPPDPRLVAALREIEAGSQVLAGVTVFPSPRELRAILGWYLESVQTERRW